MGFVAPDFDIYTVNRHGRAIVYVTGEIDMNVAERFGDAVRGAQGESTDVIVDLSGVSFIDSSGIRVLINARGALTDGSRLRVVGPQRIPRRVFEVTGVADLLLEEKPELRWTQVSSRRPGFRQWMTDNRSNEGVPVAIIVEVEPWAGCGGDTPQYLLEMSGRQVAYPSLPDAMNAAEGPTSTRRQTSDATDLAT